MKTHKFIVLFFIAFTCKAQYFNIENMIINSINFKNTKANSIYKTFKTNSSDIDDLLTKLNFIDTDSIVKQEDLSNIAALKALKNLEKNYIKNAVINATQAKKIALQTNNDVVISNSNLILALINQKIKAYNKTIDNLEQCNYTNPTSKYQINYFKAQMYFDIQAYDKVNKLLLNILNDANIISKYDYIKCLSFLVKNATQNNDDALALIYALKFDSIIKNTNQATPIQELMNKNIKYNDTKTESFSSFFVLQNIINKNNIGFIYRKLGDYKSSENYLIQSINELKKYRNDDMFPEIKTNIGLTYTHLKKYREADDNYKDALKKYIDQKNTTKQAELFNIIAKNNFLENNSILAIQNCENSIELSISNSDYVNLSNSYFILSEVYALNSDYQKSQNYFKLYTEYKNKAAQLVSEKTNEKNDNETKANVLQIDAEEEIANREKKDLELIKTKLETKQKEQELLLFKKDNELKENTIKNQLLEKEQALKSLALIKEQFEKEKLIKEFDRINKERSFKGLENEKIKTQNKLLNSERKSLLKEKELKEIQARIDKRNQQFLLYGLFGLLFFLILITFGFYTNFKQKKLIQNTNTQLQVIGENLQSSNTQLEDSFNEITEQKKIIEDKNNLVMDSINYSSKIQKSLLLNDIQLKQFFNSSFVIDLPRDVVGGDFYLVKQKDHKTYIAMVDCTGHGVPGALISIIGYQEINHIIDSNYYSPAQILQQLNTNINKLVNTNINTLGSDGMDVMLLEVDSIKHVVTFAGARSYLLVYNSNSKELNEFKGDRVSIGESEQMNESFINTTIPITQNDIFYLYTDGFQDQSSQITGKRIGSKLLKQTIEQNINLDLTSQKRKLLELFNSNKGQLKQTDDVTLLAFQPQFNLPEPLATNANSKIKEVLNKITNYNSSLTNLVVVYGLINQDIIISTIKLVETRLIANLAPKGFVTKVKVITTEMLQNIIKHQSESDSTLPYFVITDNGSQLQFITGNVVDAESMKFLNDHLNAYKLLNEQELKEVFMKKFETTHLTSEGNAGLGLLTILTKVEQEFNFDFINITNNSYHFNFEVYLNKAY